MIVNGPYPLNEVRFWALIHPLLILSLIAALIFNWNSRARRKLIAISFLIYVILLVVSGIYFIPELILFQNSPQSTVTPAEWVVRGRRWQQLSWLRGLISYLAYVPLIFALTKPSEPPA